MNANDIACEAYVAAVAEAARNKQPADIAMCQAAASAAVLKAYETGLIELPLMAAEWAREKGQWAHRHLVNAGKSLLRKMLDGQLSFADLVHDVVCPLGEGQVAFFGNLDATLLSLTDRERFSNLEEAQEAYATWRRVILDAAMPVLIRHSETIAEAVTNGHLM